MKRFPVATAAPRALDWPARPAPIAALHVFEHSCTLLRTDGAALSLVNPALGPGPFNAVLAAPVDFRSVHANDPVRIDGPVVAIAGFRFDFSAAVPWDPRPDWAAVSPEAAVRALPVLAHAAALFSVRPALSVGELPGFRDPGAAADLAGRFAGLGPGLTPSGDDVLIGLLYAARILEPAEAADRFARETAEAAAVRTTRLSAAWLRAAGAGEAAGAWHGLVAALISGNPEALRTAAGAVLRTGHSSGADAMAGFVAGLRRYA